MSDRDVDAKSGFDTGQRGHEKGASGTGWVLSTRGEWKTSKLIRDAPLPKGETLNARIPVSIGGRERKTR
jgi:hypothetical protein